MLQQFAEAFALLLDCSGLFALCSASCVAGYFHANAPSQFLNGVNKAEALILDHKLQSVAVNAAAKTMVSLSGWADVEAWTFLAVKGAKSFQIGASLFQFDVLPHHINDVEAADQLLDEFGRDHAASLGARGQARRPMAHCPSRDSGPLASRSALDREVFDFCAAVDGGCKPARLQAPAAPSFASGLVAVLCRDF